MKTTLPAAIILGISLSCITAHAGTPVPDYTADRVSDHVYVIHGPTDTPNPENLGFMNNPALVIGSDSVMILDPGGSRALNRQLAETHCCGNSGS